MSLQRVVLGTLFGSLMIGVTLTATIAEDLQNPPGMKRDERVKVAREILDHIWTDEELETSQARGGYTQYLAYIDPVEAANFILEHPIKADDGILWYQNARIILFSNPQSLPDELILRLLDAQQAQYAFFLSTNRLAECLAKDREQLKAKIAELIRNKEFRTTTQPHHAISFQLLSYDAFGLKQLADAKRQELHEYYASGDAKRDYEKIEEPARTTGFAELQRIAFRELAPEEFKEQFQGAPLRRVYAILADSNLDDKAKAIELRPAVRHELQRQTYQTMALAQQVLQIAPLDRELAVEICDKVNSPFPKVWARINLAVAIAKDDPDTATQLLKDAYREIEKHAKPVDEMAFDYNTFASNYPMALIGGVGLRGVELVAPDFLPEATKIVSDAALALLDSQLGDARSDYFETVAAVARYDRQRAQQLLEKAGDEVRLGDVASYFVALAAIDPNRILEEYEFIPMEGDERGIKYRPYIRNSIIPALCAMDDTAFWDELARHSHLVITATKNSARD